MKQRLIHAFMSGGKGTKVYFDPEWEEFIVKYYEDGKHLKESDYFTDDRTDAVDTARKEIHAA